MNRLVLILVAQGVLAGIELLTSYDTTARQGALAVTNIAATAGLLWFDRVLRRRGARLSTLTILVVLAAVWIDALGNFQHLYARYWWYDRLTHAVGGWAVSALWIDFLLAGQSAGRISASPKVALWLGFLLGQFVASMYEVSEWVGDELFDTARVRSAFDAPRDLLNNLVGGLLAVAGFWRRRGRS